MQLHSIRRSTPNKKKKTIGRGGKRGTYSSRGIKGQNARAGHRKRPEIRDTIKKIPRLRGVSVNGPQFSNDKFVVVNLGRIENVFPAGAEVSPKSLVQMRVLRATKGYMPVVKILGSGSLTKKLIFRDLMVSASAKEKIVKAGGHHA